MLVNRRTFYVKKGRLEEAVALLMAAIAQFTGYTRASRIYTPEIGAFDVVAVEWEYTRTWRNTKGAGPNGLPHRKLLRFSKSGTA